MVVWPISKNYTVDQTSLVDVGNKSTIFNIAVPYLQTNDEQNWQWRDWKLFLAQKNAFEGHSEVLLLSALGRGSWLRIC